MTIGEIIGTSGGGLVVLLLLIEITPLKINPWTAILSWIGKRTNTELAIKVDKLSQEQGKLLTRVNDVEAKNDLRAAVSCRLRILRFGDEIRMGAKHSQEHFEQVLDDMSDYKLYCDFHPEFKNERTVSTSEIIRDTYQKCLREGTFL